jgi:P-type Cu+ transporter
MSNNELTAVDPICGMTVNKRTAIQAEKGGATYYFCCPRCRERFLATDSASTSQPVVFGISPKRTSDLALPVVDSQSLPSSSVGSSKATPPAACCGHGPADAVIPSGDSAYFCPMCPGEESDQPGYCGTCGMALERNSNFHDAAADAALAKAERIFQIKLFMAFFLASVVFLVSMLPMVGVSLESILSPAASAWLQCLLTTPILLMAWPYWKSGFGAIRHGSANMFTLIGIGAWSAYLLSLVAMLAPHWLPDGLQHSEHLPLYFESAAVIVTLVMLGQWLEGSARKRTSSDLEKLVALLPKVAHQINGPAIQDVDPLTLQSHDRILIKAGEAIPADSILEEGSSDVDESLVTGESLPVTKNVGDRLIAGTINQTQVLQARVLVPGNKSMLSQMIQLVGNAQRSRAPIQDTVDRVTQFFVPVVIALAGMAALGWWWFGPEPRGSHAFLAALSVLVIACPCALGLATPMSIIVGVGRGAREGYLIRDAQVFQKLARIDTMVLDKTGTITEGKPQVVSWVCDPQENREQAIAFACALEQTSDHPLARAIVQFGRKKQPSVNVNQVDVTDIKTIPGAGTVGLIEGERVAIGKGGWIRSLLSMSDLGDAPWSGPNVAASSEVWMAIGNRVVARIQLADQPRATAARSVERLKQLGLQIELLSGDRGSAVESVAKEVGIETYRGEVTPEEKREHILGLQRQGRLVAMVGDGVNDAPSLASAEVGISLASGTDLANQASDITLLEGDLRRIEAAIRLSRQVVLNIKQNLTLGLMYNVIAIPVAAGVVYPWTGWTLSPMLAAAAMAASSLSVVGNALRLRLQR